MAEKSVDDRALDVATQVLHHIDTMYPGMWKGVPASARTSLWNTIISAVNVRFRPAVETDGDDARDAARYRWMREHYLSYEFTGPHGPTRLTRNVDPDLDGWMDAYRLDKPYSPVETAGEQP